MTTQNPAGGGPVPPAGSPGAPGAGAPRPHPAGFFQAIRGTGLYRSEERWVGGVAGGLAARFGLDPLLVRGAFLVTLLLGGFGLVIYAFAWAFLPEERDGRIHFESLTVGHPDIALLGALLMFIAGAGRGAWLDWPLRVPGWLQGLFWLGATVLVIVVVASLASQRRPPRPYPGPGGFPGPGGPAPFTGPAGGPVRAPMGSPTAPAPGAAGQFPAGPGSSGPAAGPSAGSAAGPSGSSGTGFGAAGASGSSATYAAAPGRGPVTEPVPPAGGPAPSSAWTPPPAAPAPQWAPAPPNPPLYTAQPYRYAPAPVPPPAPPKPPRRGPGATTVGVTIALALFVLAGVLIADRAGWLDRPTMGIAGALVVVIFGVAIIVTGLRGRTSGVLGFLAVVAMVVAAPLTLAAAADWGTWTPGPRAVHAGTGTTSLTERDAAADGIEIGLGDATIDLTDVPMTDETLTVPIQLGAGDFTVRVPEGADVAARVEIGAGNVTWRVDGDDASYGGLGRSQSFGVPAADAQLSLRVNVGAGDLTIEEG